MHHGWVIKMDTKIITLLIFLLLNTSVLANQKNNKFAGYCKSNDGEVYATFYKNNCFLNEEISFSEYAQIKKITINDNYYSNNITKVKSSSKNIYFEEKYYDNLNNSNYEDVYIGEIKNGRRNGLGKYTYGDNGQTEVGLYKNGDFILGVITWKEYGEKYCGEIKKNNEIEYGIYSYKEDGHYYSGSYKNDKREGFGIYHYENGEYDLGEFKNGSLHGYGILYNDDNSIFEQGKYKKDKLIKKTKVKQTIIKKAKDSSNKAKYMCSLAKEQVKNYYDIAFSTNDEIEEKDNSLTEVVNKSIFGKFEGYGIYEGEQYPIKVTLFEDSNGKIMGTYTHGVDEYEGTLYEGFLINKNKLKIFWAEGNDKGWFKITFKNNFSTFEGDFGIIENNNEGPKLGTYYANKIDSNTLVAENNSEDNEINNQKDISGPQIYVAESIIANEKLTAIIEGTVSDQNLITSLSIDGKEINFDNDGKFSENLFVKPKGQTIEIVAVDKFSNKSSKFIKLLRKDLSIKKNKFEFLDPRKISVTTNSNDVALIIGIEKYENTFAAPYAENDALAFGDFANTSLGVPYENIKILTNDNADRTKTLKTIRQWLPKTIKEDQTNLYLFYSGHGLASEDGQDLYLLPADGDPELLEDSTILRSNLFNLINDLNPKSVTVFLDTCYSGATRSDELLVASRPIFIEAEEQEIPSNFTIFSASAGKETAKVLKEAEHGLFSYFMMKGLEGEADSNNDRTITNGELHAFINKNVSRQANQTPQLFGDSEKVIVKW